MYGPWTTAAGIFAALIFILVFAGMAWVGLWGKRICEEMEKDNQNKVRR